MSENSVQSLFHNFEKVANFVQHHVSNFIGHHIQSSGTSGIGSFNASIKAPFVKTTSSVQPRDPVVKGKSSTLVTKEDLGRATWTFLHTLAAQYPDNPTRQQKKDVKELYRSCLECTLAVNVQITLKKFLDQILYSRGHMLNFLSGYVMCIMLSIEASTNQFPA
ncbi:unnamed protein product [Lathyrus oleraceus]